MVDGKCWFVSCVAAAAGAVCCRPDLGIRVVCEQVSHHPPVSAFHVESDLFVFHGAVHPKIKFWGKSIDITPKGVVTLVLKRYVLRYASLPACNSILSFREMDCVNSVFAFCYSPQCLGTMVETI